MRVIITIVLDPRCFPNTKADFDQIVLAVIEHMGAAAPAGAPFAVGIMAVVGARLQSSVMQSPPPYIDSTGYRCTGCGYDLSGSAIGGSCPECGTLVDASLRAVQVQDKSCGMATASMILGILSLVVCGILGPVAIILYFTASREMAHGGYNRGSHTMAKAGLIMGIVSIALNALGFLAYLAFLFTVFASS